MLNLYGDPDAGNLVIVNIGDVHVGKEPSILQAVLGSCVSVCLWDREAGVGGMNHFMLPRLMGNHQQPTYSGPESIRALFRKIRQAGANPMMLKAKLFGGGRLIREFSENLDIGKENVRIARQELEEMQIPVMKECIGGDSGIKVIFYPSNGRAFVKKLGNARW
jgi:chemotaxis protein CheD